jgi:hypothetical protein
MKKFLHVNVKNNELEIDLEVVKKFHVDSLAESNRLNFGIKRTDQDSAAEVTDALFSNNTYVINWINRNLKWELVKNYFTSSVNNNLQQKEWDYADKMIVEK